MNVARCLPPLSENTRVSRDDTDGIFGFLLCKKKTFNVTMWSSISDQQLFLNAYPYLETILNHPVIGNLTFVTLKEELPLKKNL